MTDLDTLWGELLFEACASDGAIRDGDVKEAIRIYRLPIEKAARAAERDRMLHMRKDYNTLPHAQFPIVWPDWREYEDVLPRTCECKDCRLWRSGS